LWIPVSDFLVTPVLAWWHAPHPVWPRDPAEVARVARLPVDALADPANRLQVRHPSGWTGPAFLVDGLLVWGFTAGVLAVVLELAGWARPWPRDRIEELPTGPQPPAAPAGAAPELREVADGVPPESPDGAGGAGPERRDAAGGSASTRPVP